MMSMLLVAAALLAAPDVAPPGARCERPESRHVEGGRAPAGPQRLAEMPRASRFATIFRTDERGCSRPVVLQHDIGGDPPPR